MAVCVGVWFTTTFIVAVAWQLAEALRCVTVTVCVPAVDHATSYELLVEPETAVPPPESVH